MRSVPHYLHHYPIVSHNEIIKEWFNTFAIDLYTWMRLQMKYFEKRFFEKNIGNYLMDLLILSVWRD